MILHDFSSEGVHFQGMAETTYLALSSEPYKNGLKDNLG